MGLRAIIVEKDPVDRQMFSQIVSDLGHEVAAADGPDFCRAFRERATTCPSSEPCHDVQIVNNLMSSGVTGLEFIDWQRRCGCKIGQGNCAVISVVWPPSEIASAADLGVKTFTKPFLVKDLVDWIYRLKHTAHHRRAAL